MNMLPAPPRTLDRADVLYWLASEGGEPICRYPGTDAFYLFKCDGDWNVVADCDCGSVEDGMDMAEKSYGISRQRWRQSGRLDRPDTLPGVDADPDAHAPLLVDSPSPAAASTRLRSSV